MIPTTETTPRHTLAKTVFVPIRITSAANAWDHWRTRSRKNKQLRSTAFAFLSAAVVNRALPATITFTRLAPRELDDDNLAGAFKSFRDGVADYFGVDDGDKRYTWRYAQRRAMAGEGKYGAVITIERETP